MFLVTSITMLRERTSGTLERLMTMPLAQDRPARRLRDRVRARRRRPGDARLGARVRAARARRRRAEVASSSLLAVANAVLGSTLGLFVSAFAQTEFQAVQFMPAVVFPQILLCGLFVARDEMATWLRVDLGRLAADLRLRRARAHRRRRLLDARFALDVAVVSAASCSRSRSARRRCAGEPTRGS